MTEINLKGRQLKFLIEYVKDFNATQAAIRAGYSEKTAYSQGSRLLKNVEVIRAIDTLFADNIMSANEVLFHLTEIGRGDIADVTDSAGLLDMPKARANSKTRLIRKIRQRTVIGENSESHEVEVEMYDRLSALGLLAKYHDLTNRVKVEDWRTEAIADIRAGRIDYPALAEAFDTNLATELFRAAGVPVEAGKGTPEHKDG